MLTSYPGIDLKGLRITINLSHVIRYPSRDQNPELTECEARVLTVRRDFGKSEKLQSG
jgi:hypothetical protein